jgi:hypothetical protein
MRLERVRPMVLRGTFHAYELAALTASARYVVEARPVDIPDEALDQLRGVLAEYDEQVRNLTTATADEGSAQ